MKIKFIIITSLLWTVQPIIAQEPFICQGQYFLSLSASISSNSGLFLVEIDPDSGTTLFNPVATSIGATMNAIGYRRTDNYIYGVNPNSNSFRLYRVGADGVAVDLGVPQGIELEGGGGYFAGDVTPDGNFLLILDLSFNTGKLAFIDLNDPNYQVTTIDINSPFTQIYDIAFDPFTGDLYGFSTGAARLVKINTVTGAITSSFPVQSQVQQLGALFFDVSGDLFGYGTINGTNTLVTINKETGIMSSVANGPPSGGEDGCSCPYTITLKKTVSTNIALPCTQVIYSFIITNNSGITQTGLELSDIMPDEFTVLDILSNPYGGTEILNGSILDINGMTVPLGTDSIHVLVEIGPSALGFYQNQAVLGGLPPSLGEFMVSDNPNTFVTQDSTPILIQPLDVTFIGDGYMICPGEVLTIDASLYGVSYLWDDGSTNARRIIDTAGFYGVTVTTACDQVVANFEVTTTLNYTFLEERYFICENQQQTVDVSNYGNQYVWNDDFEAPIRTFSEEGNYSVTITNACDITIIDYEIFSSGFYVNILDDLIEVELGDAVSLDAIYWANNNSVSFQWVDSLEMTLSCYDCQIPMAGPLEDATYTLIMTVENGCIYYDEVLVKVLKDRAVYIPNIISPNKDAINDYFYVQSGLDNLHVNKMSIFDRWGSLVHTAKDFPANQELLGWDGYLNGQPIQSGTFVYMLELEFLDGYKLFKSGDVTVIR